MVVLAHPCKDRGSGLSRAQAHEAQGPVGEPRGPSICAGLGLVVAPWWVSVLNSVCNDIIDPFVWCWFGLWDNQMCISPLDTTV